MRWTATIIDGHEDAVHIVHEGAVLHRLTPTEARALAAELVRVADEGETVTERSCFTCAHDEDHEDDDGTLFELGHFCKIKIGRDDIFDYCVKSGAFDTHDGMPTDRSIPCPGWSAKVAP